MFRFCFVKTVFLLQNCCCPWARGPQREDYKRKTDVWIQSLFSEKWLRQTFPFCWLYKFGTEAAERSQREGSVQASQQDKTGFISGSNRFKRILAKYFSQHCFLYDFWIFIFYFFLLSYWHGGCSVPHWRCYNTVTVHCGGEGHLYLK